MGGGFAISGTKLADGEAASIPSIYVPSSPASDKNTLTGMVPPIAYSKVNASTPPMPDAGAQAQKSMPPMGAQALPKTAQALSREDWKMNISHRPLVQDLVKQAMANATQRAQIAAEGARQMKLAEDKCPGCDDPSCDCNKKDEKKASAISTDYALKLAAALDYAVPSIVALSKHATSSPEGVMESHVSGTMPGPGQQGHGHMQPPMHPGMQKAMPKEHGATQLENTLGHHVPGVQTTAMSGGHGKTASLYAKNLRKLAGPASDLAELHERQLAGKMTAAQLTAPHEAQMAAELAARRAEAAPVASLSQMGGVVPERGLGSLTSDEAEALMPKAAPKAAPVAAAVEEAAAAPAAAKVERAAARAAKARSVAAAEQGLMARMSPHLTGRNAAIAGGGLAALGALGYGAKKLHDHYKEASDRKGRDLTADEATMAMLSGGLAGRYGAEKAVRAGYGASEGMLRGSLGATGGLVAGGLTGGLAGAAVHPALVLPGGLVGGALGGYGGYQLATSKYDNAKEAQVDNFLAYVKQAEDAINPAQISAGPAVPPDTSASGEAGGAPVAGMPQGPHGLIHSNDAAINYKKQTAYSPRKSELAQYFNEPALSSATDKTLNQAFAHTGEAGAKIASAQLVKSAAARALLSKLATETH